MTSRDMLVIEFLTKFKVARTSTIQKFFFDNNLRVAQRRMHALVAERVVKRVREKTGEYIYYIHRPKHFAHAIAVTDYLAYLSGKHDVSDIRAEYQCGDIRSDALVKLDGKYTFIEVQLTGTLDMLKYLTLRVSKEWQNHFEVFPDVRAMCDYAPKDCGIPVVVDRLSVVRDVAV